MKQLVILKMVNGPEEVLIIQDMSSRKGEKLISLGALPFINICYMKVLLWVIHIIKKLIILVMYLKIIIFDNKYPEIKFNSNNILNGFPCIETTQIEKIFPNYKKEFNSKKFIVGIWANKHYSLNIRKLFSI